MVSTCVFKLLKATSSDWFCSFKYILLDLIVVLLSLLTSVITLAISNLLPDILALSATLASTIRPSAIASEDFIPSSSIRTPFPLSSYKTNVKFPPVSFPIWIRTFPLSSFICNILP